MMPLPVGEIGPDTAAAPCAACGEPATAVEGQKRARAGVAGKLLMLCLDATACCRRYRRGLGPQAYAAMVRRGEMP